MNGGAAESLLDSYESERRPVAQANVQWSVENSQRFGVIREALAAGDAQRLTAALDDQKHHLSANDQDLGFHYEEGALVPDGTPAPSLAPGGYVPVARPGHRAPHVWLRDHDRRISTLDLFDRSFVLLAGSEGHVWVEGASTQRGNVPLDAYRVGAALDLEDDDGEFARAYGIEASGAVLVRPDGHVALRCLRLDGDPAAVLRHALDRVLARALAVSA
jgi:hypothetical protein